MADQGLTLGQSSNLTLNQDPSPVLLGHTQSVDLGDASYPYELALGFTHNFDISHQQNEKGLLGYENVHLHSYDHNNEFVLEKNEEQVLSRNQELVLINPHELGEDHSHGQLHVDHTNQFALTPFRQLAIRPNYQFAVGQEFPNVESCRRALREAAIACHFEIQTVKSDKTRFTAKCAAEGCPWRIHAAKLPTVPTFTIRTISGDHTCSGISHHGHHQASVQWVANTVEEKLLENPQCQPKDIIEEIHRVHGITLSYKQAWRGKERIMTTFRGSLEEGYRLLPQYCDQICRTNPGSIALVYGNSEDNCFRRLFISYYASIYGFVNACRPIIGLDRTDLKSKYLGTLLLASGIDGDGALFPLAFAVVDEDSDDNWAWFLSELRTLLESNTENMPKLTFLSNRKDGIVAGVEVNFPSAFHVFCMHHLSNSFRQHFDDAMLVNLLWEAAQAFTPCEFEAKMAEIESISSQAASWIRSIPFQFWASSCFVGTWLGRSTANVEEYLKSLVLEVSGLPLVQMMECIRRQLMNWFNDRREMSMQWSSILVPSAERKVLDAEELAAGYHVTRANDAEFQVFSPNGVSHVVDIRHRFCHCRGWEVNGLPCVHGAAALSICRQNVHRFAENYFTVATYRKTYSQTIHPIPDKSLWKELSEGSQDGDGDKIEVVINPPRTLGPPVGPRRRRRVRTDADVGRRVKRVVHCSRCNQTGHFRTTCVAPT